MAEIKCVLNAPVLWLIKPGFKDSVVLNLVVSTSSSSFFASIFSNRFPSIFN